VGPVALRRAGPPSAALEQADGGPAAQSGYSHPTWILAIASVKTLGFL
jgi:hypothetical protein